MQLVHVTRRAARDFARGRPWVFSNEVRPPAEKPLAGAVVRVVEDGAEDRELGTAFYNPSSLIALRSISREGRLPDAAWIADRLHAAADLRKRLFPDSDSWRLCHGEADGIPGLVVDRYADVAVVQAHSAGADGLLPLVTGVLVEELGFTSVVERNDVALRALEGLPSRTGTLFGEPAEEVVVRHEGTAVPVRPLTGQKTGSFLDQRENRRSAARHARGRRVLDLHCNAGGFGIEAALAGASEVTCVDTSAPAVEQARRAAELNGVEDRMTVRVDDAEDVMEQLHGRRERHGLVLLDPPSFTRSKKHVAAARHALQRLNRRAMTLVESGGVLVTSCCSHHVRRDVFLEVLRRAAAAAERDVAVLEVRGASADHPVLLELPEAAYLTCVIARVR